MKKYSTAIIALVSIILAVVAYFVFVGSDGGEGAGDPSAATKGPAQEGGSAFPFASDSSTKTKIARLDIYSEDHIILLKESGTWICANWEDEELNQSTLVGLISRLYNYTGTVVFEGDVNESVQKEFGLDGEQKLSVSMQDGTQYTIIFGSLGTSGISRYVWLEGADKIYLYSDRFRQEVLVNKAALISNVVFNFADFGQIVKISISKKGQSFIELSASISGVVGEHAAWTMSHPVQRPGHNINIQAFLNSMMALTIEDIEVSDCTEPEKYGLKPAVYSVTLTAPDKTISVQIGNKTADGTGYYFTINEGTDVYIADAGQINFLDISPVHYLNEDVFITEYTNLSHVEFTLDGKTHTMDFVYKGDDETFYMDGKIVPSQHVSDFKHALLSLYLLEITGLDLDNGPKEPSGEVLFRVRYEQGDGTVTNVTCTVRDTGTMYYYVNDVYTGGYGPQYLLTSDVENVGIRGTFKHLFDLMNIKE